MWYLGWMLGIGLVCAFTIIHALRFEGHEDRNKALGKTPEPTTIKSKDTIGY